MDNENLCREWRKIKCVEGQTPNDLRSVNEYRFDPGSKNRDNLEFNPKRNIKCVFLNLHSGCSVEEPLNEDHNGSKVRRDFCSQWS